MKRLAMVALIVFLVLIIPWERLFNMSISTDVYEINSFEDISEMRESGIRQSVDVRKSVGKFVFAQPDEERIAEIERLAEKYSTDKIKIVGLNCIPDHLAVTKGHRVTNYISVEYVVEITPDNPEDGILDEAKEWKSNLGGMKYEWQYGLMVCRESYKFVNAENGRSFTEDNSQYYYSANTNAAPLNENEQKTFDIVNNFIAENYNERGKTYTRLILQKLGVKDDELFIGIHFASTGLSESEIEAMFAELAESLKADESARAYMNGAEKIRVYLDKSGTDKTAEYIFEV